MMEYVPGASAAPHFGAADDPVPKQSNTCSDRAALISPSRDYSMDIVEVRRNGDGVAAAMSQMPDWLDSHRIEPRLSQLSGVVLLLGFDTGREATAFADAF